jgi:thiol-disulfide isomerase/thioredoxin
MQAAGKTIGQFSKEMQAKVDKKLKEMLGNVKKESVPDKPAQVTDASFMETIQSHPLVVVDCWAAWCGPCRMFAPVIDEMAQDSDVDDSHSKGAPPIGFP